MAQQADILAKKDYVDDNYQPRLVAGTGISINPITNEISSSGGGSLVTYAGNPNISQGDSLGVLTINGVSNTIMSPGLIPGTNVTITTDIATGAKTIAATGGTTVTPNPQGAPSGVLTSIGIGNTIYSLQGGAYYGTTDPDSSLGIDGDIYIKYTSGTPDTINAMFVKINGEWLEAELGGGGASDLDDLTDVDITSPTNGQVLKYNSTTSRWENGTGGGGIDIEANPSGAATDTLNKIRIDQTIYDIKGSEGGYIEKELVYTVEQGARWETFTNPDSDNPLLIENIYKGAVRTFIFNPNDLPARDGGVDDYVTIGQTLTGININLGQTNSGETVYISLQNSFDSSVQSTKVYKILSYNNIEGTVELYSSNAREDTITLSQSFRNFEYINLVAYHQTGPGYWVSLIYKTSVLQNGQNIGIYDDSTYMWYNITNDTTLQRNNTGSNGYYIAKIYGFNIGGGGGNANIKEITQAEYDALTPIEKENDTMYLTHDGDEEVDLTVRMTNYTSTSGTASAVGAFNNNFLAWHAFASEDSFNANYNGEYWAGNGEGAYLQFDFTNAISITKVAYASYQYSSFDLMYSTDGTTYNLAETLTQADQGTAIPTKQDYILNEPITNVRSIRFVCNGIYNIGAVHIYGIDGNITPNRIYLNGRKYAEAGSGSATVIANPEEEPTDALETIQIDNTVYNIPGGLEPIEIQWSAYRALPLADRLDPTKQYFVKNIPGGGDGTIIDDLFENDGTTNPTTITFDNQITDYDIISFQVETTNHDAIFTMDYIVDNLTIGDYIGAGSYSGIFVWYTYTDVDELTFLSQSAAGHYLSRIRGTKFGSGGGGGDVADVRINGATILDLQKVANIPILTGATDQTNGTLGLAPAPLIADKNKVLGGNGTYVAKNNAIMSEAEPLAAEGNDSDLFYKMQPKIEHLYEYIRFKITATKGEGTIQFSEISFKNANDQYFNWTGSTAATNISTFGGEGVNNVIDNQHTSGKMCGGFSNPTLVTITLPTGSPINLDEYPIWEWYTANDAGSRDPYSFELLVSHDGETWETLDSQTEWSGTSSRNALAYSNNLNLVSNPPEILKKFVKFEGEWVEDSIGDSLEAEEMTTAEYNLLPTADKQDAGVIHFINDTVGGESETDVTMTDFYNRAEGSISISVVNNELVYTWNGGNQIGGSSYYPTIIPATVNKIKYKITTGGSYSTTTQRFKIAIGVKATYNTSAWATAEDTDWLAVDIQNTQNTVYEGEVDLSNITVDSYLMIGAHGWTVTFNEIKLIEEVEPTGSTKIMYKDIAYGSGGSGSGGTVEVEQIPQMTSATAPSGSVSRSSIAGNQHEGWYAFDGHTASPSQLTNAWLSSSDDYTPWIRYDWTTLKQFHKITIQVTNNSTPITRQLTIEGKKGETWENCLKSGGTAEVTFYQGDLTTYEFALNDNEYSALRITGNDRFYTGAGGSAGGFSQIQIFSLESAGGGSSSNETNYSTEEQVIGTWIDGNTLYQKSIQYPQNSSLGSGWNSTGLDVGTDLNLDKLISIELHGVLGENLNYESTVTPSFADCGANKSNLRFWLPATYALIPDYITIRYTKNTV